MLQIAEILPREKQGILACFSYEPILVKQNLQGLHKLIKRARETPIKQNDASQLIQIESRPLETAVEGTFYFILEIELQRSFNIWNFKFTDSLSYSIRNSAVT